MIGVGLEKLGVEDFIAGNFFNGDLLIDEGKKSYQALGFKSSGFLRWILDPLNLTAQKHQREDHFLHSLIPAILGRIARAAQNQAKALGISGNMEGDGFQKGGVLIVDKAGKKIFK